LGFSGVADSLDAEEEREDELGIELPKEEDELSGPTEEDELNEG